MTYAKDHAELLTELLVTRQLTLEAARAEAAARGVKLSVGAMCAWRQKRAQKELREQKDEQILRVIAETHRQGLAVVGQFAATPPPELADTFRFLEVTVAQLSLKLLVTGQKKERTTEELEADTKEISRLIQDIGVLMDRVLKFKTIEVARAGQALEERRVQLLEKKAAAFDQASEVVKSTLTPEEQAARLREILK